MAPESAADFAFLLHGLHHLKDDGVMAIILPHGVLFRGGAEARIREKLLRDGHVDTVIGLPANLFDSTGIPVCVLVLKKCKRPDGVLFVNAEKHFDKGKRLNVLSEGHIEKVVAACRDRTEEDRFSRRVPMAEIEGNDFNLNLSRYVSTAEPEGADRPRRDAPRAGGDRSGPPRRGRGAQRLPRRAGPVAAAGVRAGPGPERGQVHRGLAPAPPCRWSGAVSTRASAVAAGSSFRNGSRASWPFASASRRLSRRPRGPMKRTGSNG